MAMSEFRHMSHMTILHFFPSYIPANNRLCVGGHKNCTLKFNVQSLAVSKWVSDVYKLLSLFRGSTGTSQYR